MTDAGLRPASLRFLPRAAAAFSLLAYLAYVFELARRDFLVTGLGDWMDPYFINALLEHWYRALTRLGDPSSPPIFFPIRGTLGYSHGLMLYVPFYVPLRLVCSPFVAYNLTLVLVMATGTTCLYLLFRRGGVPFLQAVLLSALFLSSANVVNGETGVWTQRASVFLIPPIALIFAASLRIRGGPGVATAALAGFLATSMYVQDFYTAHLAALIGAPLLVAVLVVENRRSIQDAWTARWSAAPAAERIALVVAAAALTWAAVLWFSGGLDTHVLGIRLRSRGVLRPFLIGAIAAAAYLWMRPIRIPATIAGVPRAHAYGLLAGAAAGAVLFLWIYVPAYREHHAFPEQHLLDALVTPDPARWTTITAFLDDVTAYPSPRTFVAVLLLTGLVWWPGGRVDRRMRACAAMFLLLSAVVFVLPLRFGGFSPWRTFVEPLPGFGVIRDPKRIAFLYELAAVTAIGALIVRLGERTALRGTVTLLLVVFLAATWNHERLERYRPVALFERVVEDPIAIDPSCHSFFMTAGPPEYASRSIDMFTLYGSDAAFIALKHGIPTLNGYSAWTPRDWGLHDPHRGDYLDRVRAWIARHALTGVCAFDPRTRTMTPFR